MLPLLRCFLRGCMPSSNCRRQNPHPLAINKRQHQRCTRRSMRKLLVQSAKVSETFWSSQSFSSTLSSRRNQWEEQKAPAQRIYSARASSCLHTVAVRSIRYWLTTPSEDECTTQFLPNPAGHMDWSTPRMSGMTARVGFEADVWLNDNMSSYSSFQVAYSDMST